MKKFLFALIVIMSSIIIYNYLCFPNFEDVKVDLKNKYKDFSDDDLDKVTYKNDVLSENKIGLTFPQEKVEYAKVFGNFYSFPKNLNSDEISFLIKKFNDSSSFKWGEIGTFIHYKTIAFYNESDEIIGLTEVDEDFRQTYSVPMLRKMKWGYLVFLDENDSKYFEKIVN